MYVGPQIIHSGNLLFRLARYLWGEAGRWLRIAIFFAAGTFFLILGAALTGIPGLVALAALTPLVPLLLVPVRVNPLWLAVAAAWPDRFGGNELRRGARWVIAVLALQTGMAFYYAGVEYLAPDVDRTLVLVTFALFVFASLLAASPPGKAKKWAMRATTAAFLLLTLVFLFGGKTEFGHKLETATAGGAAQTARCCWEVTLAGPDHWVSTGVNLDTFPGGLRYSFSGPEGTRVRFVDEGGAVLAEGLITENFGVQGGVPEFAGPAGATASLRLEGAG
jgi:hypothetical protein